MAASTSSYNASHTLLGSSDSQGEWKLAVPLSVPLNDDYEEQDSYEVSPTKSTSTKRATPSNGTVRPPQLRTNTADSQGSSRSLAQQDGGNLRPGRINQLARKRSDISATQSDPDSLLDLYTNPPQARNGTSSNTMAPKRKLATNGPQNSPAVPGDKDSAWIHRDKLAQIESRELEEAGFKVPRSMSRASSTGQGTRDRSRSRGQQSDGYAEEEEMPALNTLHSRYSSKDLREERNKKAVNPVSAEEVEEVEEENDDEEKRGWDLRTPGEIAADRERQRSGSRPGLSRLPVARDSPKPVPYVLSERDSPLTRSRQSSSAAGNSILEPAIIFNRQGRSGSVGSQVLLDDLDTPDIRSPTSNISDVRSPISPFNTQQFLQDSPPKGSKSPTKAAPTGKKVTSPTTTNARNVSQPKGRQASQGAIKRPGTSGGVSRPSTSHRPEGEAPWIATMYKPDPSLPPDQQIIPTHAKRIAQQQWEKEGKTGTVYDRDFRLLNAETFPDKRLSGTSQDEKSDSPDQQGQWPLNQSPLPSPKPPSESGRQGGGYKTIPTITSPQIPPPRSNPTPVPAATPKENEVRRNSRPTEEPKEKRGGCRCIVM